MIIMPGLDPGIFASAVPLVMAGSAPGHDEEEDAPK